LEPKQAEVAACRLTISFETRMYRQKSKSLIKLAFVGCGRVTETRHLPALRHFSDTQVVALADINLDRLNKVADLFHIRDRYTDYRQLLKDRSIDAVAVCVPAQFHVEVALAALDAGKHLFIEKPLALNLEESDQLIERAARFPHLKVIIGFNMRWHRLVRQARAIIQQGDLGRVQLIRTVLTSYHDSVPEWRKHRELGGGVLFEQAVHHFDLWRFLLQSEVVEVFATSRSRAWEDEVATVAARMANGVLVSSVLSERTSESNEIEIYGQGGRLRVDVYRFDGFEYSPCLYPSYRIRNRFKKMTRTLAAVPFALFKMTQGGDFLASYQAEWRHFLDAIRQDTLMESALEDGRSALQVALAAVKAASLGRSIKITPGAREDPSRGTEQSAALLGRGKRF
jgi:predicted dehydrogenase